MTRIRVGQVYEDLDETGTPNGRLATVIAVDKYVVLDWGVIGESQILAEWFKADIGKPYGWALVGVDHVAERPPRPGVLAALDQAVASAQSVRTGGTSIAGEMPGHWDVTAVQIPWREWVALVAAIREQGDLAPDTPAEDTGRSRIVRLCDAPYPYLSSPPEDGALRCEREHGHGGFHEADQQGRTVAWAQESS